MAKSQLPKINPWKNIGAGKTSKPQNKPKPVKSPDMGEIVKKGK